MKALLFLVFASALVMGSAEGFSEGLIGAKAAGRVDGLDAGVPGVTKPATPVAKAGPSVASVGAVEATLALLGLKGAEQTRPEALREAHGATGANQKPETRNRAVVLVFVGHDCPISNAMMPELNRIVERFAPLGAAFYFVYPESDLTEEEAVRHAGDFGGKAPVVVDRELRLVRRAGVKVTPEAAIFVSRGQIAYRGRVNDLYAGLRQRKELVEAHDLQDALETVIAGKQPPVSRQPAFGCFILQKP